MRGCYHRSRVASISLLALCFLLLMQTADTSGFFELQLLEVSNPRGLLSGGGCCGGGTEACSPCRTFLRLCLKEYQSNVTTRGSCSFGNATSGVLGGNSFTLTEPDRLGTLVVPFAFRWTRSFTLILQALHSDNVTEGSLITEASFSGIILPSPEWHTLKHIDNSTRLTYRMRVQCDPHYFNATCTKFCRPREDNFGHHTCDHNGDKVCIAGWRGTNCDIAVCKPGCHATHGKCRKPGDCECRPGWQGEYCDECTPYPGCKHGYCNGSSWQCICDTNWGGILCDQDLNYCGRHEPCKNGGTCENPAPDQYSCTCRDGFSGPNCEVVDNPCATQPCANGGTCTSEDSSTYRCDCAPGWTSDNCRIRALYQLALLAPDVDECESAPCLNGGTCVDMVNGYRCDCPSAWEGDTCQSDLDECKSSPCVNAIACVNLAGSYECRCQPGWAGTNCTINIDDCTGQCLHGTCIDLVNGYRCACPPGYTGRDCLTDINDCNPSPCRNGGECVDLVHGYSCICPVGYTGPHCENQPDHCHSSPCRNSATCLSTQNDYYCLCPQGWSGKNCTERKIACIHPPCEVEELTLATRICSWRGQPLDHNSSWEDDCNTCSCHDGVVRCTRVWCGLDNCRAHSTDNGAPCKINEVCVPAPRDACLTPGCVPWGDCRALEVGKRVGPPRLPAPPECWPNQAQLGPTCARLTLLVEHERLPPAVAVEGMCRDLRRLLAAHASAAASAAATPGAGDVVRGRHDGLVLLCELKNGYNDTIEVTIASEEWVAEATRVVSDGVRVLGELLGRKQLGLLSALSAVVEVRVETALLAAEKTGGNGYLVAVVSVFAGVLFAVVCSGLLYWRQQRRLSSSGGVLGSLGLGLGPEPCHSRANLRSHDDEKSNNLQNEENLRRYTNPLKEDGLAIGGSLANLRTSTSHHSGLKVSAASVSDLQNPRVSVVRPMSASIASLCASDAEIIEMLSDKEHNHQLPADSELYKAPSPDMRNNTNAAMAPQKDLNKQGMSLSACPVQRTFDQVDRTVLV